MGYISRHRRFVLTCLCAGALFIAADWLLVYGVFYLVAQRLPLGSAPIRTLETVAAYQELGAAGPRCVNEAITSYDPRRTSSDRVMVADPPEETVASDLVGHQFTIERVTVYHRIPHAQVWVNLDDGGVRRLHVLTLVPRTGEEVALHLPHRPIFLCYAHVGSWMIVDDTPAPVV